MVYFMTWPMLLLSSWLTFAWIPNGGIQTYDAKNIKYIDANNSYYVELGSEINYGILFASGIMRVPCWKSKDELTFWPNTLASTIGAGIKIGILEIGWEHTCTHAVVPHLGAFEWAGKIIAPVWDSASDTVYATVRTDWK